MQKTITHLEHPRHTHMVGDGFRVAQYIPGYGREMSGFTSPFLMLDYNAPNTIPPQKNGHRPGVGFHPHRGFETVTIVYSGEVEHQDTAGNGGIIGAGEVQWMTAGCGLLHNEFFTTEFSRTGGVAHFVQLWVNLPKIHKMTPPRYQALTRETIPEIEFDVGTVRVIAGNLRMLSSSDERVEQKGGAETYSQVELYDIGFQKAGSLYLTLPPDNHAMVLVIEGSITIDGKTLKSADMVFLSQACTSIEILSHTPAKILFMAGLPFYESVAAYGPFVMNTEEEIRQAFEDFHAGKMG